MRILRRSPGPAMAAAWLVSALSVGCSPKEKPTGGSNPDSSPPAANPAPPAPPAGDAPSKPGGTRLSPARQITRGSQRKVEPNDPAAEAILNKMLDAYANCKTYQDEGTVDTDTRIGGFGMNVEKHFYTAYARPNRLRFEFSAKDPFSPYADTQIVWVRGSDALCYGIDPRNLMSFGNFSKESRRLASVQAALLTAFASSEVPLLLMPDQAFDGLETKSLNGIEGLRLEPTEDVEGATCDKISGMLAGDMFDSFNPMPWFRPNKNARVVTRVTLWVERDRNLLRRLHQVIDLADAGTIDVPTGSIRLPHIGSSVSKTFKPVINEPVQWHDLTYDAPDAKPEFDWIALEAGPDFKLTRKSREAAAAEGRHLLDEVLHKYAACRTYQDTIKIVTGPVSHEPDPLRTVTVTTAFSRPGGFRYAFDETYKGKDGIRQVVWLEGDSVKRWQTGRTSVETVNDMENAFLEAQMLARVPVNAVCGALLPHKIPNSYFIKLRDIRLLGEDKINGSFCHKLAGHDEYTSPFVVWIGKKSKSIRRIQGRFHGYEFAIWMTLDYAPKFDAKLKPSDLRFNPKSKKP